MLSGVLGAGRKANHRRIGDQRRDARDWSGAAHAYAEHLEAHPGDRPIWVQRGHALKEQGLLGDAADAYQAAVDLDPRDADANLHLADALRRLNRGEDALAAYQRANDVAPNAEAMRQIRLLRHDPKVTTATIALGEGTTLISIQDLFGYLKAHVTMSGIQRVQAGIALHAIRDAAIEVRFILSNAGPESQELPAGEFWMVDNAQMLRIITYASGKHVQHDILREMLKACEETADRVRPLTGSTIILLGAFWGLGNGIQNLVPCKRDGVRIGAYVYDIIPVTHPEFCDDALVADFSMAICELCATADFILTISDATQVALTDFIDRNGGRPIPMTTVPLAHHLTQEGDRSVAWPTQLGRVRGRRYVAYVSTIEGRKNHLYVVNAWRRLMAEGVDVPDLVFVGRHGWKIGALTDLLAVTDNLGGRLHIAHGLSDGELNAVYAGCEFSVFTSFVEGWGLPVGESLFHGRPCVASGTSSIPEVGGDLVDYVDPFNLTDGVEVLRRMITDRTYLRSREEAIRTRFVARSWADVGGDFLDKVKQYRDVAVTRFSAALTEGAVCSFTSGADTRVDVERYFKKPSRLLLELESGFLYRPESQGVWLRGQSPELSVMTDMAPGTSVLAYLRLFASPGALNCQLRIVDKMTQREAGPIGLRQIERAVRMPVQVGPDGALHLQFDIRGSYSLQTGDERDFAIGLRSIGCARPDNAVARQELIEAMTMHDLTA